MAEAKPSLAPVMTLAKYYARKRVLEASSCDRDERGSAGHPVPIPSSSSSQASTDLRRRHTR